MKPISSNLGACHLVGFVSVEHIPAVVGKICYDVGTTSHQEALLVVFGGY